MKTMQLVLAAVLALAGSELLAQNAATGSVAMPQETSTMHTVVYVELKPGTVATALAALDLYGAAQLLGDGFLSVQAFEQVGRPGHLVLVESWRDQAAMDSQNPAARADLATALDKVRLSDIDLRPYRALHTAAGRAGTGSTVYVISHVDAAPAPDLPALLQRLVENSRQEAGNLRFDILQHAMRGNHYTVIEAWQDAAALEVHAAAAHTRRFRDEFGPFAGSPLDERLFNLIHTVNAD